LSESEDIESFIGGPANAMFLTQHSTLHDGIVTNVNSPNGNAVQVTCEALGIKKSSWVPFYGMHVGNNDPSHKHTGLWLCAQPGQQISCGFTSGEPQLLMARAAYPTILGDGEEGKNRDGETS
jgi:hypothetical protein